MINTDIFGYREDMWGEVEGERVLVRKRHMRSALDAAVPPGQAIEFQFYVAQLPFHIVVTSLGDHIGTTERRVEGAGGTGGRREAAGGGRGVRARGRGTTSGGAGGTTGGTTVMALRRPLGLPDIRGGMFELPPDWPPPPPPDFVIPFEITLTPPSGLAPIVLTNPKHSQIKAWPSSTARLDPDFIKRARGLWRMSVRNINDEARRMEVSVTSVHAITPVSHQDIPLSLLNNISSVALQKASPTIEYDAGNIMVSTPTHFLDLMGMDRSFSIGAAAAKILDDLPTFTPFWAKLMSRDAFVARLEARKVEIDREFQAQIQRVLNTPHAAAILSRRNRAINACNSSIQRLRNKPAHSVAYCLVLEGMFTNPEVEVRVVGTVAEIENAIPQIGLLFSESLGFTDVISNLAIDLSPILTKIALGTAALTLLSGPILAPFALIGGIKLYNSVDDLDLEEEMRKKIREKGPTIASYVKRAFERITDIGAVALHAKLHPGAAPDGSDNLHIKYFTPSTARPPRPWRPIDDAVGVTTETLEIATGEFSPRLVRAVTTAPKVAGRTPSRGTPIAERYTPFGGERAGRLPADFKVPSRETLARLDDHDCIVVVMMENRSFDHYFHELSATFPNRGYSKPPKSYVNPAPPGFDAPFPPVRNVDIGIGNNLIFWPSGRASDPGHNYDHTMFQIGGGTAETMGSGQMRGFAADFAKQSDSPQIVMSYFGMDDLPVYKALAKYYPICDRWFAALPVGTYPNRLSSLQGNVPFLYNIHMDDPSLGYLEDYSIFDLMNSQGITWKFFESDIGTLRMYDRYRLDVRNVRPITELDTTLQSAARANGALPRVMFIEPQFLFGDDDHPPMDVKQGQQFLRQVIGKFIEHGLLDRALFVITYDEHGGFFDHVPPPGTPAARTASRETRGTSYGAVESLFPQDPEKAPTCLGVRVPSVVLSKWASPRASHAVLDHTAILKTILLHNRSRISTAQFGKFGERVKKRNHLGVVLDLQSPRAIDYAALAADLGYQTGWAPTAPRAIVASRDVGMTPSHPGSVLRGIAQPRGRIIV